MPPWQKRQSHQLHEQGLSQAGWDHKGNGELLPRRYHTIVQTPADTDKIEGC